MTDLGILIVLYRCRPQDSATIRTLLAQDRADGRVTVTLWDNSPEGHEDCPAIKRLRAAFGTVDYVHCPDNLPLSQVYNRFVQSSGGRVVLILDQDSTLPATHLAVLQRDLARFPDVMLFVPRILSGGSLISPGRFGRIKGGRIGTIAAGLHRAAGHTAIASGMAIRTEVFDRGLTFNEDLWLYAIDTDFFLRFRDRFDSFCVMDVDVIHGSALRSALTLEQRLFRFRTLRWAHLQMLKSLGRDGAALRAYLFYLSVKHAVRYGSLRFLTGWDDTGRR